MNISSRDIKSKVSFAYDKSRKTSNEIELLKITIMGYVALHLEKAKGNDSGTSAHIERTVNPKNADETRTHLNRKLIDFPQGVENRTQAIQYRLDNAGLERKIGKNQVRAIRIMLTGTHEDMVRIQKAGKLDAWCKDSLDWVQDTFGKENLVSAVLHLDEKTPHIHATVVPITTGERRKAKQTNKNKYRKKNINAVRLCADDVMARAKLKSYQDSYAEKMAIYGLERGVDGSKAKHTSTQEYYRDLSIKNEDLTEKIESLQEEKTEVYEKVRDMYDRKDEVQDKFLKLDDYVKQKSKELTEVESKLEKANRELNPDTLRDDFNLLRLLFPKTDELLRIGRLCIQVGFSKEDTQTLASGKSVNFSGSLYSEEHKQSFKTENSVAKIVQDKLSKLKLSIDGLSVVDWFKQKYRELQKSIDFKRKQSKSRGL